jgi:hypothetical protein
MTDVRAKEVTLGSMRSQGVGGLLVRCVACAHSVPITADQWPDDARLSDLEPLFVCQACGHRGADVRPDFDWQRPLERNGPNARGMGEEP